MTEFETIHINDLKPADYNPRVMKNSEMEKLKKGLKNHGLIDPIIIDLTDENTIIGGHQRLQALQELHPQENIELKLIRLGDIGLVINETNLKVQDKNDQKAKNLALNKITGEWDYKLLDDILLDLAEDHYDIDLTGFDKSDILFDIQETNIDETIQQLEKDFEPMTKEEIQQKRQQQKIEKQQQQPTDEEIKKTLPHKILKLEILFETEEEMTTEFDKLVSQGYNVRMSNSWTKKYF